MKRKTKRNERHQYYVHLLNQKRWYGEVRINQLRKHPLCQMCEKEGYIRSAVDVHHINPVEGAPGETEAEWKANMEQRCYDENNLISLCVPCHIEIHRRMKSHRGQTAKLMPQDERPEQKELNEWVQRVSGGKCEARPRPKKGVRLTPYGWMTKEEFKEKQQENHDKWKERMLNRFTNGHQDTTGAATVDDPSED